MLLQIHLVRNNVLGFGFLMPHEEYPDKLDGYSTLWLERGNSMICQRSAQEAEQRLKSWCWNPYFTDLHPKPTASPTTLFKAIGSSPYHMESSALPPSPTWGQDPPCFQGLPSSNAAAVLLCLISGTASLKIFPPHEILVNDLNASSLHH